MTWTPGMPADWRPEAVRKYFSPATVIDVGAGHTTPAMHEAFPDAHHVFIEPLEEYARNLDGEFHPVAVGDRKGSIVLLVDTEAPWLSSVFTPTHRGHTTKALSERRVPLTTLDALWQEHGWPPPFGLKIDTEGYEDRVIMGASKVLEKTQFVILEANVEPRFEGSYHFAELIALMDSEGFRVCDALSGLKGDAIQDIIFLDLVFRRNAPRG